MAAGSSEPINGDSEESEPEKAFVDGGQPQETDAIANHRGKCSLCGKARRSATQV